MSGSMFIAVRTNDGTLLYANGHSRSAYNVFSYKELFDGDDAKAIEFIREWNEGEPVPTHVRPLEYGAVIVDFPTRQILVDSYYDTNIHLMSNLAGGSFIQEMKALGRTRTASDEELRRPVFDLRGNLWDGTGEMPQEGGDKRARLSYDDAFYIDYSPWNVRCLPETPGGRIAFLNAVEECGFPVRRDLWENRSCETENEENRRVRAGSDIRLVMSRLARKGIHGEPLWSIDEMTGSFRANIILKFKKKSGTLEHVIVPIELSGNAEMNPVSRTVGAWHADETKYTNGAGTFSDMDGEGDWEMIPHSQGIPVEDRLDLFACLLLGAGERDNRVLRSLSGFYEDGDFLEDIPFARMSEVHLEHNVWTADAAETSAAEIETIRREAERRLRQHWAVYDGKLLGYGRECFWCVRCRDDEDGMIEIAPSVYGGKGSATIHGYFGAERRDEAFAYAERLHQLGCGSSIVVKGDIEILTPGASRAFVNHGDEISEMAEAICQEAFGSFRKQDRRVDKALETHFRAVSKLVRRHRTEWEGVDRAWPLDAEWKALWKPISEALGDVAPESLEGLDKPKNRWGDPARFWRIKAALDMVTFPERLKELAGRKS